MTKRLTSALLFAATVGLAAFALAAKAPQAEAACGTWTPAGTTAYCPSSSNETGESWTSGYTHYVYTVKDGSCGVGQSWGCGGWGRRTGSGAATAPFATYGVTASDTMAGGYAITEHQLTCGCFWDVD